MEERYQRNLGCLSQEEMAALRTKTVFIAGCGGLGCYVAEELCRLGIGKISIADGDIFEATNLNRQLYCDEKTLGKSKVLTAKERLARVNPEVGVTAFAEKLTAENAGELLSGCDLAIDALDSGADRKTLAAACAGLQIPLVHGAISGWRAQISVLAPGSDAFGFMYPEGREEEAASPSLAFTPALCASLEVAEAVKVLLNKENTLTGRLLIIDLLRNEFNIINL